MEVLLMSDLDMIVDKERQLFLNKCLKEIDGEDALHALVYKATQILNCSRGEAVIEIINYYINNQEHFDCNFHEWLLADNAPIVRSSIKGLFPEFEFLTSNKYEIAKLVKEHYGIDIKFDFEGYEMYSFEFNWKELNAKRLDLDKIKEEMKAKILEAL